MLTIATFAPIETDVLIEENMQCLEIGREVREKGRGGWGGKWENSKGKTGGEKRGGGGG